MNTDETITEILFYDKQWLKEPIAKIVMWQINLYEPNPKAGKILGDQDPIAPSFDPMDINAVY